MQAANAYMAWNLLDMPAGVVPVSKVTQEDDNNLDNLPSNDMVYYQIIQILTF